MLLLTETNILLSFDFEGVQLTNGASPFTDARFQFIFVFLEPRVGKYM
jgi:hypothetical protein